MAHQHKNHNHNHNSISNIKVAFFLNFAFTILEFIGGYFLNSLAIMSDALHDLGDTFSLGLSWFLEKISKKKKDKVFSYGYKRFSLLAAFFNNIILVIGALFILFKAISGIINPGMPNAKGMFIFAIVGIIVNGIAVFRLSDGKSMNEQSVKWHLLEDVWGWVAVLIVSAVMMVWEVPVLDPLLSAIIALYIFWNVFKNLKETARIFLQATPLSVNVSEMEAEIKSIKKVKAIHDTHIWSIDGATHILTTHVIVDQDTDQEDSLKIKCSVKQQVEKFDIEHATVEIEYEGESCSLVPKV